MFIEWSKLTASMRCCAFWFYRLYFWRSIISKRRRITSHRGGCNDQHDCPGTEWKCSFWSTSQWAGANDQHGMDWPGRQQFDWTHSTGSCVLDVLAALQLLRQGNGGHNREAFPVKILISGEAILRMTAGVFRAQMHWLRPSSKRCSCDLVVSVAWSFRFDTIHGDDITL